MSDKNRYLASEWEDWAKCLRHDVIDADGVEACRNAFYSGAFSAIDAVLKVVDLPLVGPLESIREEMREYLNSVAILAVKEELEGKDARTDVQ